MGLPATDAFTGTNGTALQTYSANWTINAGAFDIQSNNVHPNAASVHGMAHWNADTFLDNQYAQMTVTAVGTYIGVAVRCAVSAQTGYAFRAEAATIYIQEWTAGSGATLTSVAYSTQVNDVLRLEVVGQTLTAKVNGVVKLSVDDATITSGLPGIIGFDNAAGTRGDDWEAGNLIITTHQGLRRAPQRGVMDAR